VNCDLRACLSVYKFNIARLFTVCAKVVLTKITAGVWEPVNRQSVWISFLVKRK